MCPGRLRWAACVAFGVGIAGMGMSIGHDALHGAYSRLAWINRLLGYTFGAMGASSYIWRFTHNIAHHSGDGPPSAERPARRAFHAHQLRTTANVPCDNRLLSWYVGGLNFQVEHHLFPHICSVHHPARRPIVRELAFRHRLPYHEYPTMISALRSHARHVHKLGRA